jgi:hypothetical protein
MHGSILHHLKAVYIKLIEIKKHDSTRERGKVCVCDD